MRPTGFIRLLHSLLSLTRQQLPLPRLWSHPQRLERHACTTAFLDGARHDQPERLGGIAEADELFLLESNKGSRKLDRPARKRGGGARSRGITQEHDCVLVARDRAGQTCSFVTGRAAVTVKQLHRHLLPMLDPTVLLVTDAHRARLGERGLVALLERLVADAQQVLV